MVRLQIALTLLLASLPANVEGFQANQPFSKASSASTGHPIPHNTMQRPSKSKVSISPLVARSSPKRTSSLVRPVASASPTSEFGENSNSNEVLSSVTNAAVDFVVSLEEPDRDAAEIARKQQLVQDRKQKMTYKVTLPLASSEEKSQSKSSSELNLGIALCQVSKGRNVDSNILLDLDTLELVSNDQNVDTSDENSMDITGIQRRIDGEFQGVVVVSVDEGSAGWKAGVRSGDILKTTSATLGNQLWPKSTLEGVRSAILSRKAVSESVQFEFQRLGDTEDNEFELTLSRPIGLELKETEDGYVEVTGFTEKASTLVRYAVKVGDRVLAVDSSLGGRMWPVSTVEGIISAVTARLPGQQITFRFERTAASTLESSSSEASPVNGAAVVESAPTEFAEATTVAASSTGTDEELLQRCRQIIKRYATDEKYVNKFALPGLVADKVVNALASAGTRVDPVTLSMIQTAYLSCRQPEKAIQLFEAAVGLPADGSIREVTATPVSESGSEDNPFLGKDNKQITANVEALDVYTVSALLKAHAMNGDLSSVQRVLAALEGRTGTMVDGQEVASWPGTGPNGSLQPDNRCYNIVMSAAVDSSAQNGLELALCIFHSLSDPVRARKDFSQETEDGLEKDAVSYNTIIKALTNSGRYEEAFEIFYQMKKAGLKPDKYSYQSLVKAVVADDDVDEFLYDMKETGVPPDSMTYNTIIRCLCEQKRIGAAKKVVAMMEESGVSPDSWTYGYLINGLLKSGNPSAALTLFETACSDRRTVGLTENVYIYTSAMTAAATIGDHTRALELLSRMKSLGIKPNLKTMTSLMGACLSAGKADLAVDIFRRIPNPDSYAVSKGLLALSLAGKTHEVLSMLSDRTTTAGRMQGKELMNLYEALLKSLISAKEYSEAREVVTNLLGKGNIPSKAIYQTIFESMGFKYPQRNAALSVLKDNLTAATIDDENIERFNFLLFLVDATSSRNLPCEASLYSTILAFGVELGGLPKKISALMVSSKAATGLYTTGSKWLDERKCEEECTIGGWEDLFASYDDLRHQILSPASLPSIRVRVASREVPRVLKAEKNLSYRKRREV